MDASGCLHLWMGMPFPCFAFPSTTFVSPGPKRHCVPVMLCWGTDIWECSDPPVSGMTGAPRVPPPRGIPLGGGQDVGCLADLTRVWGASFCSALGPKENCTRCSLQQHLEIIASSYLG